MKDPDLLSGEAIVEIPFILIDDNPFQTRSDYGDLDALACDIREHGQLQPVLARPASNGRYQLALGHRRKRALELIGASTIRAVVQELDDSQMATVAYSENEHRADVTAIDKARAIQAMIAAFSWTQQEIADRLSISRPTVANLLRLLKLPKHLQTHVANRTLSARQAEALLSLTDLPPTLTAKANAHWTARLRPDQILQDALAGASSDNIRDRTKELLATFTTAIQDQPWYTTHIACELSPNLQHNACPTCPHAIKRDTGVFCPYQPCILERNRQHTLAALRPASQATGLPIADYPQHDYGQHQDFRYKPTDHAQAILTTRPACKNLRLVHNTDHTRPYLPEQLVPGHPDALIICQLPGNNQCACLNRHAKADPNPDKTSPAKLKRDIIEPAAEILVEELARLPAGLLRLLVNDLHLVWENGTSKTVPIGPDEELPQKAARIILNRYLFPEASPDDNRRRATDLLAYADRRSPWTADEPNPIPLL